MNSFCPGCGAELPEGEEGFDYPIHPCIERDLHNFVGVALFIFGGVIAITLGLLLFWG